VPAQREWFEKDYYKVLGVTEKASEKDITSAYRRLAKKLHPDANPGSEDRFKEVSAAYDVLGDPARRKEYDEVRRMGPAGFGRPGGNGGPGFGGGFRVDDLGDLLGGLFTKGRATRSRSSPQRGDDLEATLNLSFSDAVDGVITSVNVISDAACHTCNGTGAAPGTSPVIC
jgi:molecular chaperone DnaJ